MILMLADLAIACGCAADRDDTRTSSASVSVDVLYHYDPLGRLIQAVSPSGDSVHYRYDAVGNITAIRHLTANTLSVLDFTPRIGTPGSTLTVYGSGFDLTPAANAVALNGVAAVVTSAAETTLVVTVPTGATTGKISVSNAKGNAASDFNYVVQASSLAPAIASFTPQVGTLGTTVTLFGTNFQTDAQNNKVTISRQFALVLTDASSPAPNQLKVSVPTISASGVISVTTPFGKAVSANEFFAVPTTVNPADVEYTGRLSINGSALAVNIATNGKKGVLLFEAHPGQRPRFVTLGGTFVSAVMAEVYDPEGRKVTTLPLSRTGTADFNNAIALDGTYTVVLSPGTTDKGVMQVALVVDAFGQLAIDGTTPVSLLPGQNGRFSFTAGAGKGHGLAITGLTFTPTAGGNLAVRLRKADGTLLLDLSPFGSNTGGGGSRDLDPPKFASAGTYVLEFDPANINAVSFNAVFSKDVEGVIPDSVPNGDAGLVSTRSVTVPIARAGQNARYVFNGTAGQSASVVLQGTLDDGNPDTINNTMVLIYKPSSSTTVIASGTLHQFDEKFGLKLTLDFSLPETGAYTIFINPQELISGSPVLKVTN